MFSCRYPVSLLNVHEKIRSKPSTWMIAAFYPVLGVESLWDERGGNSPLVGLGGQSIRRLQDCDLRLRKFKRAWLRKRRKGRKRSTGGRHRSNGICRGNFPEGQHMRVKRSVEPKRQRPIGREAESRLRVKESRSSRCTRQRRLLLQRKAAKFPLLTTANV